MMNLDHLRYFVDAARLGSLSEAARKNLVSQSAVSQAIRALEADLGVALTTHQKKLFFLTDEGREVLARADGILGAVAGLAADLPTSEPRGDLRVGATASVANALLPRVLGPLMDEHPGIRPIVRIGNSETIQDWLLAKDIDLGIMVESGMRPELQRVVIGSGHYVLFRSRRAPPRLVVTRSERPEVVAILKRLRGSAHPSEVHMEMTSWEAIKAFVLMNGGYGIAPEDVVQDEIARGRLERVRVEGPAYRMIAVSRGRGEPLTRNARLFLERLRE